MDPYEVPKGAVIVNGKSFPCASVVKGVAQHGMEFNPGRGARKRVQIPDLIVLHHTGGEGDAAGVFRVLNERGLGIEFVIDRDGVIWQMCDPARVDTFDASEFNRRSVGIEVISCGLAPLPKTALDRGTYEATVNGHTFTFAQFYGIQLKAIADLCDTLTAAFGIPRIVCPARAVVPPDEMAKRHGVVGHFHLNAQKTDPGTQAFDYLKARGFEER